MASSKRRKTWQRYIEDANIIYGIVGLIGPIAALVDSALSVAKGSSWDVVLKVITVLFPVVAVSLFVRQNRKLARQLATKHLPVCFVAGRTVDKAQEDYATLKAAVTDLTGFSAFDKIEGFTSRQACLLAHEKRQLPADILQWKSYIAESIRNIQSFADALAGGKVYHVAIDGPASLAIGLGTVFGTKYPLVCYHFNGTTYDPVLDLRQGTRRVKEHLPPDYQYRYFKVAYPNRYTSNVVVVLQAAGHLAAADVRRYAEGRIADVCMVEVDNTYEGNLTETDWVTPVRELFSVFTNLAKVETVKNVHLFHAMPVAMGFGLGMTLGQFKPVTVYNWERDQQTYYPVLRLNEIGVSL